MTQQTVSVVIRVRNAAEDLHACLRQVRSQQLPAQWSLEIVVVDNDSTDASVEVAELWGSRVIGIRGDEFTWGRALNRGIEASTGEIILLLSSDAHPVNELWLTRMVEPFEDSRVAAVYGRQVPRRHAPVGEIRRLAKFFDDRPRTISTSDAQPAPAPLDLCVCSNSCAAIRREAWQSVAFDETLVASEEVPWLLQLLRRGWSATYAPTALVYHSHRDGVLRLALRHWEFHEKGCRDGGRNPASLLQVTKLIASTCRSRVTMCLGRGVPVFSRIEGLLRLPFDCSGICLVAATASSPAARMKIRSLAWAPSPFVRNGRARFTQKDCTSARGRTTV